MGSTPSRNRATLDHGKFGTVYRIDDDMIAVQCLVENEKVVKDWFEIKKKIDTQDIRQTIILPSKHAFYKNCNCGQDGIAQFECESYMYTLESQIINRCGLNQHFQQSQMWFLFYSLIKAGNAFEEMNDKIGDVHPFNILVNESGQVKIISQYSFPGEQTNFEKALQDKSAKVFLAPEELIINDLQDDKYPRMLIRTQAEVFSIGVTFLAVGILNNCQGIYQQYRNINEARLNELLHGFRQRYSSYMYLILCSMLRMNPFERRSCSSIYKEIKKFETQILNLEPFNPQANVPVHSSYLQNSSSKQSNYRSAPMQQSTMSHEKLGYFK